MTLNVNILCDVCVYVCVCARKQRALNILLFALLYRITPGIKA
jgi:hypothetical protein